MQWFRFYHKTARDPKIHRLSLAHRWCWVMVLTAASESPRRGWLLLADGDPATVEDLAFSADVPLKIMAQALAIFRDNNLLEAGEDGVLQVTGWEEGQFDSDSSVARTRKWRMKDAPAVTSPERHSDVDNDCHGDAHPDRHRDGPDTDTDTYSETETETDITDTHPDTGKVTVAGAGTEGAEGCLSRVSSSPKKPVPRNARQVVIYPGWFENIWAACPRRVEKERTLAVCEARLREGHAAEELLRAIVNYGRHCLFEGTEECYIKHPATFFGPSRPFLEWVNRDGNTTEGTARQISRLAAQRGGSFPVAPANWQGRAGGVE